MAEKKKVIAYYDGSNFYHHCIENYGIKGLNFFDLTNRILDLAKEDLIQIKYFNCPVNQQEDSQKYADQQRFFNSIRRTPLTQLLFGKLVKRYLKKININCPTCGHQRADGINCPQCRRELELRRIFKYTEKGVDVKLATHLLLDGITNKYDMALLFSSDADYCPAIKHIVRVLGKEVVYCHFPIPKTSELMQVCSDNRLITKEVIEEAHKSQI